MWPDAEGITMNEKPAVVATAGEWSVVLKL